MDLIDLLQWPAMAVTVVAAFLVGSTRKLRRNWGFWLFIVSNVTWVVWGVYTKAWALVTLQFCLAAMNIRGAMKNDPDKEGDADGAAGPDAAGKAPKPA